MKNNNKYPFNLEKKVEVNKKCTLNDVWTIGDENRNKEGYANLAEAMQVYSVEKDLSQIELCEQVYSWEKFDFTGMSCKNAKLERAVFKGCLLNNINCTGANFSKATLTACELQVAVLKEANFSNANVTYCDFNGAVLEKARFVNSDLTSCDFQDAILKNADFTGADLSKANLRDTNLENADLLGIKWDEKTKFPDIEELKKAKNSENIIEYLNNKTEKRQRSFSSRTIQRTVTPALGKFKELTKSFSSPSSKHKEEEFTENVASSYPPSPGVRKAKSERNLPNVNIQEDKQKQITEELKERFKQNSNNQGRQ
ncbi:MAG: pentapeptide repeat-containing protein [Alphaproteobacteria bacterium]